MSLAYGCATLGGEIREERVWSDPEGDDHGPGSYVYPQGKVYRPGALDLREVTLSVQAEELLVEVRFDGPIAQARGVHLSREQVEDLFIATVDLYLDLNADAAAGHSEVLPGRRASLEGDARWELAIVISPIPSRMRDALSGHTAAADVVIPDRVRVKGKSLRTRVPLSLLQGVPLDEIGIAAAVTGTVFGTTFRTEVDGMVPTAFVREVTTRAGRCDRWEEALDGAPCTFGGCGACEEHTRIIDALHPEPGVQEQALGPGADGRARLPVSGQRAEGGEDGQRTQWITVAVRDRRLGVLTLASAQGPLPEVGRLVEVLGEAGEVVATAVVSAQIDGPDGPFCVVEIVSRGTFEARHVRWESNGR